MTRFLLIRHATTDANGHRLAGRIAGVRLNAQGRDEAQALAARLAGRAIDAVYSSPLERALETAEPIAGRHGVEVVRCEDFLEIDFGEWTDRTFEALADDIRFRRFNDLRSCTPAPGGESMLQAQARMIAGLDTLRTRHPQASIAVVSHGDMIKAAIAYYAGIALDLFQRIEISPASVSVVEIDDAAVQILTVNDTSAIA